MTDPTRPTGDTADSDVADSEVACHHEWPPTADVAPHFLACVKCGHFETVAALANPGTIGKSAVVGVWSPTGHGWHEIRFDKPIPLDAATVIDPVTLMRSLSRVADARSAAERAFAIAAGHDVPPLPVPQLPTSVDGLDSDTYDRLRSRYAWLEQRHRDTVDSELAAVNARQAVEIGELKRAVEETDTERAYQRDLAQKHWATVQRCRALLGGLDHTHSPYITVSDLREALDDTPEQP